jgi:hypothetical protein
MRRADLPIDRKMTVDRQMSDQSDNRRSGRAPGIKEKAAS